MPVYMVFAGISTRKTAKSKKLPLFQNKHRLFRTRINEEGVFRYLRICKIQR